MIQGVYRAVKISFGNRQASVCTAAQSGLCLSARSSLNRLSGRRDEILIDIDFSGIFR